MRDDLPPDPIVKGKIPWEWFDHADHGRIIRLWSRTFDTWSLQRSWTGTLHEAIDAGCGSAAIIDQLLAAGHCGGDRTRALSRLRLYLFMLRDEGYIDLAFDDAPASFPGGLTVQKELGRGGVGVAWLCTTPDGDEVVVKHAWDYFQPIATVDAMMRSEAEVMAALDHPGILRLYDTFESDGRIHLVREYVDGPGLLAGHTERGVALGDTVDRMCGMLEHLHGRGYLLLDLRPSNFFLRPDDTPVLIDVGVCQRWSGETLRLKRSFGSPGFSAPETRLRHSASPASDVFGLGRLLFTLVAHRPPLADWGPDDMAPHLEDAPWRETLLAMCSEEPEARPALDEVRAAFQGSGPLRARADPTV